MKSVFKYTADISDVISIGLPVGAKPLRFDFQNKVLCLWALVDRDNTETQTFEFRMAGTGHLIEEDGLEYLNTVFVGSLVFHFFVLKKQ